MDRESGRQFSTWYMGTVSALYYFVYVCGSSYQVDKDFIVHWKK